MSTGFARPFTGRHMAALMLAFFATIGLNAATVAPGAAGLHAELHTARGNVTLHSHPCPSCCPP
mgnify:CR=1 FL=1